MQIDTGTKKQTENILMLNAIIPKACKKDQGMGRTKFLKSFIIGFYGLYDYQY